MRSTRFTLSLPDEMLSILDRLALQERITTGQLIRKCLSNEISRKCNARPPVRADEQLVAPLRAHLAKDLAEAVCWKDLDKRLRHKGYELRPAGAGLTLHSFPDGQRLCKASELGFSYSRLMRRIGKPYPRHAHTHLIDRYGLKNETLHTPECDLVEALISAPSDPPASAL